MKYLALLLISLPAFGQFGAASRILSGTGAPVAAQCTVENNVGLVWARKDGADAGTTFYVCGATGVGTYGWELRGGAPGGASTLTTVGSVPFVTSSGVLGSSSALTFATSTLTLNGASFGQVANTTGDLFLTNNAGAGNLIFRANGVEGFRLSSTTRNLLLGTGTDDGTSRLQVNGNLIVNGGNALRLQNAAGNQFASMILNSDTDVTLNYPLKLGPSNSVMTGFTLAVHNGIPTTGWTSLVVRAGAGQGSNNLQTWQNSSGSSRLQVTNTLGMQALGTFFSVQDSGGTINRAILQSTLDFNNSGSVRWSSTGDAGGTLDLSLSRASANTLQVGDGGANSNGSILARIYTWASGTEGTCDATLRGQVVMVQGGAGVADTFRVCRKDAANAYAWTALY